MFEPLAAKLKALKETKPRSNLLKRKKLYQISKKLKEKEQSLSKGYNVNEEDHVNFHFFFYILYICNWTGFNTKVENVINDETPFPSEIGTLKDESDG